MADMFGKKREYMLSIDGRLVYVSVTRDKVMGIKSNLTDTQKPNAKEWAEEVANDISNAYGGKPEHLLHMITSAL
jgi:hypothetical protein